MKASLQLYTVRDETEKDFKKAIEKVANLGYSGVEFAGFGGLSKKEMKQLLLDNNLFSVGSHTSIDDLKNRLPEVIEYNKFIGSRYIICPWAELHSMEDINKLASLLNSVSKECAKHGIVVGYHNHNIDFEKIDGKYIIDLLFEKLNNNVIMELDIYWVVRSGVDLNSYIKKYQDRVKLVHLKQLKQVNGEYKDCDIPDGEINARRVKECAKDCTDFIVEQESFDKPIWDGLKRSLDYLKDI